MSETVLSEEDERPRRRRREAAEAVANQDAEQQDVVQRVYPMPQSKQPHPEFGWGAPNPYAEPEEAK